MNRFKKRELKTKPINECRCDERLKTRVELKKECHSFFQLRFFPNSFVPILKLFLLMRLEQLIVSKSSCAVVVVKGSRGWDVVDTQR